VNALKDTRPIAQAATHHDPDGYGTGEGFALIIARLFTRYPDVDIPTIRLETWDNQGNEWLRVTGRVGPLTPDPDCPSCHAHAGHPHTEYCQLANWAGHRDNCALQWGKDCDCEDQAEQRPDDDPPDPIVCDGRDCGGVPHA